MRQKYLAAAVVALLAAAPRAYSQAPVIETVQNAASNVAVTSVAPQVLISIKGQNLAAYTEAATGLPLPRTLGGATVSFNGGPYGGSIAPLLYASPTQIDAQVPSDIEGTAIAVTVATAKGARELILI